MKKEFIKKIAFHPYCQAFCTKLYVLYLFCRMILAITHFNHNVNRAVKRRPDGTTRMKVCYPKFKNGEATVRDVRVIQNFGKSTLIMFSSKAFFTKIIVS